MLNSTNVKGAITSKDIAGDIEELKRKQINAAITYDKFAKDYVNYKNVDGMKPSDFKNHNDAYVTSVMANCLSYIDHGLTLGNLTKAYITYQSAKLINGPMDDSEAKMWESVRENVKSAAKNKPAFVRFALNFVDSYAEEKGINKMNKATGDKIDSNDIDSLIMTPQQIAVLKLNFMEQYYADVRSEDPNNKAKIADMTDKYNTAMAHIDAITKNNGYEMSQVAAQEKYFVGLKMLENPDGHYENIFNETSSIYGAKPEFEWDTDNETHRWSGEFVTSDGHTYVSNAKDANGAFTVRPPLTDENRCKEFQASLYRQGQEYAWMKMYLSSDYCPADKAEKDKAIDALDAKFNNYKEAIRQQVAIDFGYSEKNIDDKSKIDKFIDDSFNKGYNNQMPKDKDLSFEDAILIEGDGPVRLMDELGYIKLSETLISEYNLQQNEFKNQSSSLDDNANAGASRMRNYFTNFCNTLRDRNPLYNNKNEATIMTDIINVSVKDMKADDLVDLMMHAGSNIEQGVKDGKFTDRPAILQINKGGIDVFKEQEDPYSMLSPSAIASENDKHVSVRETCDVEDNTEPDNTKSDQIDF